MEILENRVHRFSPPFAALMSFEPEPSVVLPSSDPATAYAADIARLKQNGPFGPRDDVWLLLAHALVRLGAMSSEEQREALAPMADTIAASALAAGLPADSMEIRAAHALAGLGNPWTVGESGNEAATALVFAIQAVAESQEQKGASQLAYATLHGLLETLGDGIPPERLGYVLAQQGRASRELGYNDVASSLYNSAVHIGHDCSSQGLVARGLVGLGSMAIARGNYPEARSLFQQARTHADAAADATQLRNAHHGLQNCGFASGDMDAALVHGWNVLRLSHGPDARAEALLNMAEVCRLTNEHDVAIRAYAVVIASTTQPRLRMHALSSALICAIELKQTALAERYRDELQEVLASVPDPYGRASTSVELSISLYRMGDERAARLALGEASAIARDRGYHEITYRVDQALSQWDAPTVASEPNADVTVRKKPVRSESFRTILRSMKGLTAASL